MKTKQIFSLSIVLLLLILGIVVKKSMPPAELATQELMPLDLTFDASQVTTITLQKGPLPQVQLSKTDGVWRVSNFSGARVNQNLVDVFLTDIPRVKGELRGSGAEIFPDFGITEEAGLHITLSGEADKDILALVIGTQRAVAGTVFVRKKNETQVYLAQARLLASIGIYEDPASAEPKADYWISRELMEFDASKVNRIEIKNYDKGNHTGSLVLMKEGGAWKFERADLPFAPDDAKVSKYLEEGQSYMRQKILNPEAQDYGFGKPNFQLVLGFENAPAITATAGSADPETGESYYMQVSNEPVVGLLSKFYLENLAAGPQRFFADNPLNVDPGKTEKLVIRANKKEMKFQPKEKPSEELTKYLNELKVVSFGEPVMKKTKFGKFSLEIQEEGEPPLILDFADISSKEKKEYAVQKRGVPSMFSISEPVFRQLFDNPERLQAPNS
jgi:hypothetical protein